MFKCAYVCIYTATDEDLTAPKTALKIIHLGKILSDDVLVAGDSL